MLTIINFHLVDTCSATIRISYILNNIQSLATAHVKSSKLTHNRRRNRITRDLAKISAQLGLDHTHHQLPALSSPHLISIFIHRRDLLHAKLIALYTHEQEIHYHNFGIK